jgi:hypothetical protein
MSELPTWAGAEMIRMEDEGRAEVGCFYPSGNCVLGPHMDQQRAEIARLRADNERLRCDIATGERARDAQDTGYRQEIARLRKLLTAPLRERAEYLEALRRESGDE